MSIIGAALLVGAVGCTAAEPLAEGGGPDVPRAPRAASEATDETISADVAATADADRVLDGEESFPDGFTVPAGEVWEFAPDEATSVISGGNVVVQGVLRMQPDDYDISHVLRFVDIDERNFVGGGMEVLESDVGLWVVGEGQLHIVGSPRAGWNRTGTDPTWRPGDEILSAPIEPGNSTTFAPFEPGTDVPTVSYGGETYATEVLNLTRNVRIEGTGDGEAHPEANGRAHIWINSIRPQTIRYAELRHLGPRALGDDNPTDGVLGRYPLHFHMSEDGVRGSLVEGVVVRDSGNHAFVAHRSHGITFRDTIAFNVFEDAYAWDTDGSGHGVPGVNATDDLVYDHAMAAYVRSDPDYRGYVLSGFLLGEGEDLVVTDSVAVGVQGNEGASGFHWPSSANGNEHNVWEFRGNTAHNNRMSGIFVWQNDDNDHLVEDFVGYRNGAFGVDHGAYVNEHRYDGLVLFENEVAGIRSIAASEGGQRWTNIDTDDILIGEHLASGAPVVFDEMTLRGSVIVDEDEYELPSAYEFRNVRTGDGGELTADHFEIRTLVSTIAVVLSDGTRIEL